MGEKIVIIANNSGGLYGFRNEFITELVKKGNQVTALTPFDSNVEKLESLGITVIKTPIDRRGMNPFTDLGLVRLYAKNLKKIKPDLVITYTIKPNIYGGFLCRIKKIPYAANITGLGTAFQKKGMLRKFVTIMYKISLKHAKTVFFENSENQQIFLDEHIVRQEQTCLLHGAGVNLEYYQMAEYPEDVEAIRFLFMGRVMREKGVDELFEAMDRLNQEGLSCTLDVLGNYEENYEDIIRKNERKGWLHYHGYQPDVRPFIKNCHCFVLPSWHEGMANTNLECAAMGRPVITSNIHGCLEAVINGVSGYLCEKNNADDLYRVMKQFMRLSYEERRNMGSAGRRHMETTFDKVKVVRETVSRL